VILHLTGIELVQQIFSDRKRTLAYVQLLHNLSRLCQTLTNKQVGAVLGKLFLFSFRCLLYLMSELNRFPPLFSQLIRMLTEEVSGSVLRMFSLETMTGLTTEVLVLVFSLFFIFFRLSCCFISFPCCLFRF
jgi:hypothetical protein